MKIYLFIVSLFFCGISFAQTSISGSVKDSKNQPVSGANVKVTGDDAGTLTDSDGNFNLTTTKKPPFNIEISSVGFGVKKVNVTSNNQNVSVALTDEENKLDEIVVSASRTPEKVLQSPVTIERMSQKEIKNTTAATFYDGLENLKEVHFNTSSFSFKSINTRGFATIANTRFMQLVDGMDNSSPALNFPLGNLIGVSELDVASVELLPGASSALYGANAFNGIMFMNSKSPFTNQGLSFYFKYGQTTQEVAGTNDYWDFGIRAAHAFSKHFAAKANFTFMKASEWIAADPRDVAVNNSGSVVNPNYDGLNSYGDEVSTNIKSVGLSLANLGLIPQSAVNLLPNYNVARTGYREQDLNDNNIKSLKADFSFHFKPWADENEIIFQHKLGLGNTIYQGANRYALKNFFINQTRLEFKGKNYFVRGYMTDENAGDSYDMRFAAWNVNRAWKSDATWFGQYAGAYIQSTLAGATPEQAHGIARSTADTGRFLPGSTDFNNALATVTADPDLVTGSKFQDKSKLYHADVNYNFRDIIKVAEIQLGGSYRQYEMNSSGTIFTDYDGPLRYDEYGVYGQVQKKFMKEERLKFTGSIRYDKSQNFDGSYSPRVSFVYSAGANKQHNFRASYQTGFRNPTTQDQYIGLNLGPFALIGSAPDNLSRYVETLPVSTAGQVINGGNPTATLSGVEAYGNSFTLTSVQAFSAAVASGQALPTAAALLEVAKINLVKPERVQAFDIGYRSVIKNLTVDISGYYNIYNDFLNQSRVITPYYGDVNTFDPTDLATYAPVAAISNGDRRVYQVYDNSKSEVTSLGFGIGLSNKIYKDFELSANYNYAEYTFDQAKDPSFIPSFNTPKHRVKASLGNQKLFKNFGFNTNVRWNTEYLWQSSFADGMVPENVVFDAQINYAIPKLKSVLKVGANNLFGKDYIQVIGAGAIGQQWFASITINP
ncbi:TonB-dependent receptor [Flavobacterium paronense]|uniref:TonB-dependent receptor domain-containing protein n=1 Tax=Flavobacterium paronense TaxID=1392775 RepID=A0ABV5GEA0_9FLAO|nr:TonB-dependent receptor [Flavobacterium paronense]MDN3678272.1 TonB-dependent receptor [Flavobacterium paronense]